jgi:hypothetical protein
MTTGRLDTFRPQGDVFALDLTVAGPIKDLFIKGNLGGNSTIRTQGPVGNMNNIRIAGSLDGDILSSGRIKNLYVGGNITGDITAVSRRGTALNNLFIGGTLTEGGLNIRGNVGKITVGSSLGITGTLLEVTGNLKSLTVKGDLFSSVRVGGILGRLTVGGSIITGATIEARRINGIRVAGDVQPGVIFRANRVRPPRVGGQMLGEIQIV